VVKRGRCCFVFWFLFCFCHTGAWTGTSPWATLTALFDGYFGDTVRTICPRLASNLDPPDLCLLSS
jgi:hypothetical protein